MERVVHDRYCENERSTRLSDRGTSRPAAALLTRGSHKLTQGELPLELPLRPGTGRGPEFSWYVEHGADDYYSAPT